jgi:hypothetical protein
MDNKFSEKERWDEKEQPEVMEMEMEMEMGKASTVKVESHATSDEKKL